MSHRVLLALTLAILPTAHAQYNSQDPLAIAADDYRGGWKTEAQGIPRTYQFSIRGNTVRGVYCTWCADATTLAFVDGKFDTASGLTFTVTHVDNNGKTTWTDQGTAKFQKPNLVVSVTLGGPRGSTDNGKVTWTMTKDERGPDPLAIPIIMLPKGREVPVLGGRGGGVPAGPGTAKGPAAPPAVAQAKGPAAQAKGPAPAAGGGRGDYVPPGPWLQLTPDIVAGSWVGFGNGVNKQYFIIKKVGNKLRGMVCGRCDNPYTMAALDNFAIDGEIIRFDILHEDWGDYSIPFDKHVAGRISGNELRAVFYQDNLPPELAGRPQQTDPGINGTTLIGPIAHEATKLNHWK